MDDNHGLMESLRRARSFARLWLACFALALGVAAAAPLIHPQAIELVCGAGGQIKAVVHTDDGVEHPYDRLVSTLPLPVALELAGVAVAAPTDPHTSVLVVNLGAEPGPALGDDHWVYDATAPSGFHRFGVYSNVDEAFLPASARSAAVGTPSTRTRRRASLYVERAYPGGARPSPAEEAAHVDAMVHDLQQREVIGAVEVVDPTWIEVAYTWSWPGSSWRAEALSALEAVGVHQAGRYGRWRFQGIAASLAEGRAVGAVGSGSGGR